VNVDRDLVGPNYEFGLRFQVSVPESRERFRELVELDGTKVKDRKPLDTGSVFAGLTGFDPEDRRPAVYFRHSKSGVWILVVGSKPLSKFNFWAVKTTACPEPFHALTLKPGEGTEWEWRYHRRHSAEW